MSAPMYKTRHKATEWGKKTMKQPVLLCYNLTGEKMQKIRLAAMRLKIRVRPVEKAEYAQTIAALCGAEDAREAAYTGAGFEDEMLVMANFPAGMMNTFLGLFRRMGIAPVALTTRPVRVDHPHPHAGLFRLQRLHPGELEAGLR